MCETPAGGHAAARCCLGVDRRAGLAGGVPRLARRRGRAQQLEPAARAAVPPAVPRRLLPGRGRATRPASALPGRLPARRRTRRARGLLGRGVARRRLRPTPRRPRRDHRRRRRAAHPPRTDRAPRPDRPRGDHLGRRHPVHQPAAHRVRPRSPGRPGGDRGCGRSAVRRAPLRSSSEGETHATSERVLRDVGRYPKLVDRGWRLYRYPKHEVYREPERIVAELRRARLRAAERPR